MKKAMRGRGQGFLSLVCFVLLLGQPTIGVAQEEESRVA